MTELARFDDRFTMRHTRVFPHPIEAVFDAVTISDEMNKWMMPIVEVEPRLGGECWFSWGGAWHSPPLPRGMVGTVSEFDPPHRVTYTFGDGAFLRFELEDQGDATTRLVLIQHRRRAGVPALTLWPPNVVHGFHIMLDDLGALLAGITDEQWARDRLRATEAGQFGQFTYDPANAPRHVPQEVWRQSNAITGQYAEHIARKCPREEGPTDAERDAGPYTLSVRGVPDEEVTLWAEAGGFGPMLDVMFDELRDRLDATKPCRIGFNLGRGLEWSFDVEPPTATVTRRPTGDDPAVVSGSPMRMLRALANGLTTDELERLGLTVAGDPAVVAEFCTMAARVPTG